MLLPVAVGLALLSVSAQAACIVRRQSDNSSEAYPLPENDPFYHPSNYTSLKNGQIICMDERQKLQMIT
jgi:hypothetical protein